jgi:PIN domain-containing protein
VWLPEPYVFFVDRSLGGRVVAGALRAAGVEVRAHEDLFAQDTDDEVWLADQRRGRADLRVSRTDDAAQAREVIVGDLVSPGYSGRCRPRTTLFTTGSTSTVPPTRASPALVKTRPDRERDRPGLRDGASMASNGVDGGASAPPFARRPARMPAAQLRESVITSPS